MVTEPMRSMPRLRRAAFLTAAAVCALRAVPAAAGESAAEPSAQRVAGDPVLPLAVLDALDACDAAAHEGAAARLAKLPWRDLVAAIEDPGDDPRGLRAGALRNALAAGGPAVARDMLAAAARDDAKPLVRLVAWQTAARPAAGAALRDVIAPLCDTGGEDRDGALGRAAFRDAVAACLARSPYERAVAAEAWPVLDGAARTALLDGVEAAGASGGDRALAAILPSADADPAPVLERLARAPFRRAAPVDGLAAAAVARALEHQDPAVRAPAALVEGRLGGMERAERLRRMLGDDDRTVAAAALRGLRLAAAAEVGGDAELWRIRLDEERRWLEETGIRDLARIDAASSASADDEMLAALARAATHRLHAAVLVPRIERLLDSPDPPLRRAGCEALAQLGSPLPIPKLLARTTDPAPEVADAAGAALAAITGLPRPAAVAEWRTLLDASR